MHFVIVFKAKTPIFYTYTLNIQANNYFIGCNELNLKNITLYFKKRFKINNIQTSLNLTFSIEPKPIWSKSVNKYLAFIWEKLDILGFKTLNTFELYFLTITSKTNDL